MSNASNNVVLVGTVMTNVQFLTTKKGVEFAARFMLAVKKGYKTSSGYEATDLIPVRIKGENRMGFARMIHKNDRICLSGFVSSEKYETKDGTKVFSVLIDADHVEWASNRKAKSDSNAASVSQKQQNKNYQQKKVPQKPILTPAADNTVEINLNFADLPFS